MESGKIYGMCGRNGSGKTMLMRAISGLINPNEGYVKIDEKITETIGRSTPKFYAFTPSENGYYTSNRRASRSKKL